jgi:CheY-like chemotaxis protein
MDMQMPVMDGVEVTINIISKLGAKAPPIIAMTANAFEEDRQKCFDAGMVDFIPKRIALAELRRVIISFSKTTDSGPAT